MPQGDGTYLVGRHDAYIPRLNDESIEIQRGHQRSDGTAHYHSGNMSDTITFRYTVALYDNTSMLQVLSLNFDGGIIFMDYICNIIFIIYINFILKP